MSDEAAKESPKRVEAAYGLLWSILTADPCINDARRLLLQTLDKSAQERGIRFANDSWLRCREQPTNHETVIADLKQKLVYSEMAASAEAKRVNELTAELRELQGLRSALAELYALVKGACPALLDDDRDGDGRLDMKVRECLNE